MILPPEANFASLVYLLCALTSILCAVLLVRGYLRNRTRLLLWSSLCFAGLAANNILLFVDLALFPSAVSLALPRTMLALISVSVLVYGLVVDSV